MSSPKVFEEPPFVIDETRTTWDADKRRWRRYATAESVADACRTVGKASLATQAITFTMKGKVHEGPFAEIAAQECEVDHLATAWPKGFLMYAGMIEAAQTAPIV